MDVTTIGALVAIAVAVVGAAWRLGTRLGAIERTVGEALAEIRADARAVERRIVALEARNPGRDELRDRLVALETACRARHARE